MSRVCKLKYAMSYIRTPFNFKSKRRIEFVIHNQFERMIPHKYLQLAVHDDTMAVFSLYKQLKKQNALLVCN